MNRFVVMLQKKFTSNAQCWVGDRLIISFFHYDVHFFTVAFFPLDKIQNFKNHDFARFEKIACFCLL